MNQDGLLFVVCTLVAAAFLLWPLWRYRSVAFSQHAKSADLVQIFRENLAELEAQVARNALSQETFNSLKIELERNLLRDYKIQTRAESTVSSRRLWQFAAAASLVIIVASWFVYDRFGSYKDVQIQQLQKSKLQLDYEDMVQNKAPDKSRVKTLADAYQNRLLDKPDNLQYQFLLARLRMELGEYGAAVDLYKKLLDKESQSSLLMAELAQAMYLRDGNQMIPKAVELAQRSVLLDPKNSTGLGLLGLHSFRQGDVKGAIGYWRKILSFTDPASPTANYWSKAIEQVKANYIQSGGRAEDLEALSPYALQLQVSLAPNVAVEKESIVFIYARAYQGSPMPLAIARIKVSDLPQTVLLDETMAMSPAASLATATQVEVVARISASGAAQAQAGDWQATLGPLDMKAISNPIRLEISQQIK